MINKYYVGTRKCIVNYKIIYLKNIFSKNNDA